MSCVRFYWFALTDLHGHKSFQILSDVEKMRDSTSKQQRHGIEIWDIVNAMAESVRDHVIYSQCNDNVGKRSCQSQCNGKIGKRSW